LAAAKAAADEANRAKSDFLTGMSHELRTPLNAILGFSEIIRDQHLGPVGTPRYAEYANDVHNSGRHLLALIDDILDLAKIDAGKVELQEEAVDIARLIDDSTILVRDQAAKAGVALVVAKSGALPPMRADRRLLKQVLLNLLSNAIKFTPRGGRIAAEADYDPQRGLVLSVSDTGIGMSMEDIAKAMSPYGQVDSTMSREHKGTGLGLPISRALVKLHDGEFILTSNPGHGTTITITLPAARKALNRPRVGDRQVLT
jgi:signal transduction histidine kinase